MKAIEIRNEIEEIDPDNEKDMAWYQARLIGEIAAQLAELNEKFEDFFQSKPVFAPAPNGEEQ